MESEEEKKPFTITYTSDSEGTAGSVSFHCACRTPLTITKRDPAAILSGIFCNVCRQQWYVNWSDGLLRKGCKEGENERCRQKNK